jgi:hypothetical protein
MCKRERRGKRKKKKRIGAEAKLSFKTPHMSPHVEEGAL